MAEATPSSSSDQHDDEDEFDEPEGEVDQDMQEEPGKAKRKKGGWFKKERDLENVTWKSFQDPWTFHAFFNQDPSIWTGWLRSEGLLADQFQVKCNANVSGRKGKQNHIACGAPCVLKPHTKAIDGKVWRCLTKPQHETSVRYNAFWSNMKHHIPDVMLFIKNFLDGASLKKCSQFSNIHYNSTAVYWSAYIRDIMVQYVFENQITNPQKLTGTIEIDESLFGRKHKYHHGRMVSRVHVWVCKNYYYDMNNLKVY